MRRTSSRCSIHLYPGQNGRCTLLKIPKSECPDIWIRLPRRKWPKAWSSMEDPVVPLERNLYGHSLAGLLRERQFEKVLFLHGWEKVPNWECLFVNREKGQLVKVTIRFEPPPPCFFEGVAGLWPATLSPQKKHGLFCAFVLALASFLTFGKVNPGLPQTDILLGGGVS